MSLHERETEISLWLIEDGSAKFAFIYAERQRLEAVNKEDSFCPSSLSNAISQW